MYCWVCLRLLLVWGWSKALTSAQNSSECSVSGDCCEYEKFVALLFLLLHSSPNLGLGHHIVDVYRSHTITHTHTHTHTQNRYDSYERVISTSQRPPPTEHTTDKKTNILAINRIRTRGPSNRAAAGLRFRPHGDRDKLLVISGFKSDKPSLNVQLVTYVVSWFLEQLDNCLSSWMQFLFAY
jgi:hypothetical protein